MKRCLLAVLALFALAVVGADDTAPSLSSRRLDTLKYGIEPQVIELLGALKEEKDADLAVDIIRVFDTSTSPKIKIAILDFFSSLRRKDAEDRAAAIVKGRDELSDDLVGAAFSYLVAIKSTAVLGEAAAILRDDEKRYLIAAIKAIGAAGSSAEADSLKAVYESEGRELAVKEEIILALGRVKSASSFELLSSIATSDESTKTLRMYACTALGDLGDDRAVPVLVTCSVSLDPNVRASAITALGLFKNAAASAAIREGLRDAHVLPRIAACKASSSFGDIEALPYLEYKASGDPEKAVREAAIIAIAAIGGQRSDEYLSTFALDSKNSIPYRASAFQAILSKGGAGALEKMKAALSVAQGEKDRSLFMAYARAAVAVDALACEPFIAILLSDKDFSVKLGAIAWADRNKAKGLIEAIRALAAGDANEAVRRRATQAIDRMGSS